MLSPLSIFAPLSNPETVGLDTSKGQTSEKVAKYITYMLATLVALGVMYAGISALSSNVPGNGYFSYLLQGKTGAIIALSVGGADLLLGSGNNIRKWNNNRPHIAEF